MLPTTSSSVGGGGGGGGGASSSSTLKSWIGLLGGMTVLYWTVSTLIHTVAPSSSQDGGGGGGVVMWDFPGMEGVKKLSPQEFAREADMAFQQTTTEFDVYLQRIHKLEEEEQRHESSRIAESYQIEEEERVALLAMEEQRKKLEQHEQREKVQTLENKARIAEELARSMISKYQKVRDDIENSIMTTEEERTRKKEEAHLVLKESEQLNHQAELARKEANDASQQFLALGHTPEELQAMADQWLADREKMKNTKNTAAAGVGDGNTVANTNNNGKPTRGFIVLGMHRSGTSMLSGLLVTGMGYKVGEPLIGPAYDNAKGFFELLPAVLQNDEFMNKQGINWSMNVIAYDYQKAIKQKRDGRIKFNEGTKALGFLNNPNKVPWLQKDPRMCITLRSWLDLLDSTPAVLFTYRHPLEVAQSLKRREKGFPLERGLRLWIVYNMRAIQNSNDLCRVYSSNEALLEDTQHEVQRIADELTSKCSVPSPPRKLDKSTVDKFVDPTLHHNKKVDADVNESNALSKYGNDCLVPPYDSDYGEGTPEREREERLYKSAMKIYCDFKSGKAYERDYDDWPQLP